MENSKRIPKKAASPLNEMTAHVISSLDQRRQTKLQTKETRPVDSSRFIPTPNERFDTLTVPHQTAGVHGQAHPWLVSGQNSLGITQANGGRPIFKSQLSTLTTSNGSDSEYQNSGNGKSPVSTVAPTLSTAQTSPLLKGISDNEEEEEEEGSGGAGLESLQSISRHTHAIPAYRLRDAADGLSEKFLLANRLRCLTYPPFLNNSLREDPGHSGFDQVKRQNEASDLQGTGYWIDKGGNEDQGTGDWVDKGSNEDRLGSRLYMALESSYSKDRGFMPRDKLFELVNRKAVLEELNKALCGTRGQKHIGAYRDMICNASDAHNGGTETNSMRKIFAMLSLVDMVASLPAFVRDGITDSDLPFVKQKTINGVQILRKEGSPSKPLACFDGWMPQKKDEFVSYQWSMLAVIFREGDYNQVPHEVIHHCDQLPFIRRPDSNAEASEYSSNPCVGGGGEVNMVDIPLAHHKFKHTTLSGRGFAIKMLHRPDKKLFEREGTILSKFIGKGGHEHIVTLLATFELRNELASDPTSKFGLVFYRADGNLLDHWRKTNPSPKFNYGIMLWTSRQFKGLVNGLLQLHKHSTWSRVLPGSSRQTAKAGESEKIRQYGRHGDMKPENILCYPKPQNDNPTLVICDFGTSELRFRMTGSVHDEPFTDTYRAPEVDEEGREYSQSADIWSLGCVFLLHVAWLLGGTVLFREFKDKRLSRDDRLGMPSDTFFYCDGKGNRRVKEKVTEFIHACHSDAKCTGYLHDLLDLIEEKMLVVDTRKRETCDWLNTELNRMLEECESNNDYAIKAAPRTPKDRSVIRPIGTAEKQIYTTRTNRAISDVPDPTNTSKVFKVDPSLLEEDRNPTK